MNKEDKNLLVKFICESLPYNNLQVCYNNEPYKLCGYAHGKVIICKEFISNSIGVDVESIKPYLRINFPPTTMSDAEIMTDNERWYFWNTNLTRTSRLFLLEHCFDSDGLFRKDLALEAPKDMYDGDDMCLREQYDATQSEGAGTKEEINEWFKNELVKYKERMQKKR